MKMNGWKRRCWLALVELSKDGRPLDLVVLGFLNDPNPCRRAASGLVAGRSMEPEHRLAVHRLLQDKVPTVRLRAAQGLLAGHDKRAVPALIGLVGQRLPGSPVVQRKLSSEWRATRPRCCLRVPLLPAGVEMNKPGWIGGAVMKFVSI